MPPSLGPKRRRFLAILLAKPTLKAAAKAAKISYRTARRWAAEPTFASAYNDAQRRAFAHCLAMLTSASGRAVHRLVLELRGAVAGDRIKAAKYLLDAASKAVETRDILARLDALEHKQNGDAPLPDDETPENQQ